jgi:hypothetical protein
VRLQKRQAGTEVPPSMTKKKKTLDVVRIGSTIGEAVFDLLINLLLHDILRNKEEHEEQIHFIIKRKQKTKLHVAQETFTRSEVQEYYKF